jgi:TonB family protein
MHDFVPSSFDFDMCVDGAIGLEQTVHMRLIKLWLPITLSAVAWGGDGAAKLGYVDCSTGDTHRQTPLYLNACLSRPILTLGCGERVSVVGREGPWLKIVPADGVERFIDATAISQRKDRFVAIDIPAPSEPYVPDCSAFRSKTTKPPRIIFQREPDFNDEARKKHIQGTVNLSLVVGIDGRPHDIRVENGLGHGLDENAVKAVEDWRFEPARQDGQPIEKKIGVSVTFHLLE